MFAEFRGRAPVRPLKYAAETSATDNGRPTWLTQTYVYCVY